MNVIVINGRPEKDKESTNCFSKTKIKQKNKTEKIVNSSSNKKSSIKSITSV